MDTPDTDPDSGIRVLSGGDLSHRNEHRQRETGAAPEFSEGSSGGDHVVLCHVAVGIGSIPWLSTAVLAAGGVAAVRCWRGKWVWSARVSLKRPPQAENLRTGFIFIKSRTSLQKNKRCGIMEP